MNQGTSNITSSGFVRSFEEAVDRVWRARRWQYSHKQLYYFSWTGLAALVKKWFKEWEKTTSVGTDGNGSGQLPHKLYFTSLWPRESQNHCIRVSGADECQQWRPRQVCLLMKSRISKDQSILFMRSGAGTAFLKPACVSLVGLNNRVLIARTCKWSMHRHERVNLKSSTRGWSLCETSQHWHRRRIYEELRYLFYITPLGLQFSWGAELQLQSTDVVCKVTITNIQQHSALLSFTTVKVKIYLQCVMFFFFMLCIFGAWSVVYFHSRHTACLHCRYIFHWSLTIRLPSVIY